MTQQALALPAVDHVSLLRERNNELRIDLGIAAEENRELQRLVDALKQENLFLRTRLYGTDTGDLS